MFKITITETKTVRKVFPKQWTLIGSEENRVMGYAPEVETIGETKDDIYTQAVDEMDVLAVIAAVNGASFNRVKVNP